MNDFDINSTGDHSLNDWLREFQELSPEEWTVGDVCRAIRQQISLAAVLPVARQVLSANALEGDSYDGELLVALGSISSMIRQVDSDFAEWLRRFVATVKTEDTDVLDAISLISAKRR